MAKITATQRLQKAHVWIMSDPRTRLLSGVVMLGDSKIAPADTMPIPTAYTDGWNKVYCEEFITTLKDAQLRALVIHENLHVAYRHMSLYKDLASQNSQVANMAMDYVINLQIYDMDPSKTDIKLPEQGLLDEKYRGKSVPEVFRLLLANPPPGSASSLDGHGFGEPEDGPATPQQAKLIEQALRQGALIGHESGGLARQLLGDFEPQVPWQETLREYLTSIATDKEDSTWRRPNRRHLARDVYLPSYYSEALGPVVLAIDTSGSIGDSELTVFLTEVQAILKELSPAQVDLLYWNTEVAAHEKYEPMDYDRLMDYTAPMGGGGTHIDCVPQYLQDKQLDPALAIVFTDGYIDGDLGSFTCPVVWVLNSDKEISPQYGLSVKLN